jgi:pyruvate dehydrogenase E2 component (dihydrolipoamide acetyltransferase)
MPTKIVMPRLSLTMKEGTVGKWYKDEGNPVEKGEPIAEVVSEKATYDLEAPASGVLRKILVGDGSDVPVNAVLGIITDSNEVLTEGEIMKILETEEELSEKTILASPAAKRLARELGIDLSTIKGSGPDGRVSEEDVKIAVEKRSPERQKIKEIMLLTGNRKTTAERLSASFRNAPHSTIFMDVEASSIISLHEKLKLSYTALIAKCVADSLLAHPMINSTLDGDRITIFQGVNLGVAMATKYGLIVPIIHDADKKTAAEIDTEVERLAERATEGKLSSAELNGGTFTITNLGMFGVDSFVPIINPPEAAILAVGRLAEKPIVIDHKIEVKPTMTLSLSYDHRIVDGAPAANFLRDVKSKIEKVMNA